MEYITAVIFFVSSEKYGPSTAKRPKKNRRPLRVAANLRLWYPGSFLAPQGPTGREANSVDQDGERPRWEFTSAPGPAGTVNATRISPSSEDRYLPEEQEKIEEYFFRLFFFGAPCCIKHKHRFTDHRLFTQHLESMSIRERCRGTAATALGFLKRQFQGVANAARCAAVGRASLKGGAVHQPLSPPRCFLFV